MYGIFTYIWLIFILNVGKFTIHGFYGYYSCKSTYTPSFTGIQDPIPGPLNETWCIYLFTHWGLDKRSHWSYECLSCGKSYLQELNMGVSKNRGKTPKLDVFCNGKPYVLMDDLGGTIIFRKPPHTQPFPHMIRAGSPLNLVYVQLQTPPGRGLSDPRSSGTWRWPERPRSRGRQPWE